MDVADFKIGTRIIGHVAHIAPFGAFIDLGDAEWQGLVLIPEISWSQIHHPTDVLAVGQQVETEIVHIVAERHQLSLSIKRCQENPWDGAANRYGIGQSVEVIVSGVVKYGVWVYIKDYPVLKGLLPIAEAGEQHLLPGQFLTLIIQAFEPDKRRIVFKSRPE